MGRGKMYVLLGIFWQGEGGSGGAGQASKFE